MRDMLGRHVQPCAAKLHEPAHPHLRVGAPHALPYQHPAQKGARVAAAEGRARVSRRQFRATRTSLAPQPKTVVGVWYSCHVTPMHVAAPVPTPWPISRVC